jgi:hypothetical protein
MRDFSRGVAQPGSAPALGEDPSLPTALSGSISSLCFQQLGESAFARAITPSQSTARVLEQSWHSPAMRQDSKAPEFDSTPDGPCLRAMTRISELASDRLTRTPINRGCEEALHVADPEQHVPSRHRLTHVAIISSDSVPGAAPAASERHLWLETVRFVVRHADIVRRRRDSAGHGCRGLGTVGIEPPTLG